MSKVKQKVSGCFRTAKFAEAYCRISSYLQTMAYQGYNPLVALQWALSGRATEIRGDQGRSGASSYLNCKDGCFPRRIPGAVAAPATR